MFFQSVFGSAFSSPQKAQISTGPIEHHNMVSQLGQHNLLPVAQPITFSWDGLVAILVPRRKKNSDITNAKLILCLSVEIFKKKRKKKKVLLIYNFSPILGINASTFNVSYINDVVYTGNFKWHLFHAYS